MGLLIKIGVLLMSYLVGSIPWGFILVKLISGDDIRGIESGRTGGTNTMRAAGLVPGLLTSIMDILKSAAMVWVTRALFPDDFWFHVLVVGIIVLGHNYSIFLINRDPTGKFLISGGAGGTPAVGGIVGLWWPSFFILFPLGYFIVMVIGYASLATISLPMIGSLIFLFRFIWFDEPWQYIFAGLIPELFIIWALRPNIKRLINGTERLVGIRAKKREKNNTK
jgi:glycerol-3-phosphate acyltransferase PlsY